MVRGGPSIYHLFFADDLFLFGRATEMEANCIRRVLDGFCDASGAKVSLDKSKLYIYPHGSRRNAQKVSEILGIGCSNDLGKYLGVPLIHGRVLLQKTAWRFLMGFLLMLIMQPV